MHKISDIIKSLDSISPFETQQAWDNSGLNVGNPKQCVSHVAVALEATSDIIQRLEPHSLLITHHPLLFKPLKNLDYSQYPANLLRMLVCKDIALLALHTNFDQSHFSQLLVERVLGFDVCRTQGFIAYFELNLSHELCVEMLKDKFELPHVLCANPKPFYKTAALISGAGASMSPEIDVDCLLSGDMKYHDAMIARSMGRSIFDIRHYESERYFPLFMSEILQSIGIEAQSFTTAQPFTIC